MNYYKTFYPRSEKSVYAFFKENSSVRQALFSTVLYDTVKECEDFNLAEFTLIMVNAIPNYNGFDSADGFMYFFKKHLKELDIDDIKAVMDVYRKNNQCTSRGRHSEDKKIVEKYIEDYRANVSDGDVKDINYGEVNNADLE